MSEQDGKKPLLNAPLPFATGLDLELISPQGRPATPEALHRHTHGNGRNV